MRVAVATAIAIVMLVLSAPALGQEIWPLRDYSRAAGTQYNAGSGKSQGEEGHFSSAGDKGGGASGGGSENGVGSGQSQGDRGRGTHKAGSGSGSQAPGGSRGNGNHGGAGVLSLGGHTLSQAELDALVRASAHRAAAHGGHFGHTPSVTVLSFGKASLPLRREIRRAIAARGLKVTNKGTLTRRRAMRFLASAKGRALSRGGPDAIRKGVIASILRPDPDLLTTFRTLFGPERALRPIDAIVITRRKRVTGAYARFQNALLRGLRDTRIPIVFAERSKAAQSAVPDFKKLKIPTVDDVDRRAGRRALRAVLFGGAKGDFGVKPTADAKLSGTRVVKLKRTAAHFSPRDGKGLPGGVIPFVLLGALGLATCAWATGGHRAMRRRRRF